MFVTHIHMYLCICVRWCNTNGVLSGVVRCWQLLSQRGLTCSRPFQLTNVLHLSSPCSELYCKTEHHAAILQFIYSYTSTFYIGYTCCSKLYFKTKQVTSYILSHYVLSRYIALYCDTFYNILSHSVTLYCIFITLYYMLLHYVILHYILLHVVILHYILLHFVRLCQIVLQWKGVALRRVMAISGLVGGEPREITLI